MATITASLERSLQNCSLDQSTRTRRGGGGAVGRSDSSGDHRGHNHNHQDINNESICENRGAHEAVTTHSNAASSSDDNSTFVELNSHVSLPYHWEQCLDLKTGEIYYINWSNGMKAKQDPRTTAPAYNGDYYSEDDDDEDDDDDDEEESNEYDSEGSSTESSPCSSNRESFRSVKKLLASGSAGRHHHHHQQEEEQVSQDSVLVVAGCKSCLMYYMVPKHVVDCPKCSGQLLHFAANT